jgi:hypothetical protein
LIEVLLQPTQLIFVFAIDEAVDKILRFLAAHFSTPYFMSRGKASFS